jgi:predicted 2-oxoglutarate/Fe(II)-dependent dioxygenase YbiX
LNNTIHHPTVKTLKSIGRPMNANQMLEEDGFLNLVGLSENQFEGCQDAFSSDDDVPSTSVFAAQARMFRETAVTGDESGVDPGHSSSTLDSIEVDSIIDDSEPEKDVPEFTHRFAEPADAQKTEVARVKNVLTREEVLRIREAANEIKLEAGIVNRNAEGSHIKGAGSWETCYLHTGGLFRKKLPDLFDKIVSMAFKTDAENWRILDGKTFGQDVNVRVIEFHEYWQHGRLCHERHNDTGSYITCDIMLSENGEFEGGEFQTLEADGTMLHHEFEFGDASVFVSHKYHCVAPVHTGRRNVIIFEFWPGPERTCAHRCLDPAGTCKYNAHDSYVDRFHRL